MNATEFKQYMIDKKKAQAAEWNKVMDENGQCLGLTNDEYNKLVHKQKSSVTRRSHSRGNLWNHYNEPIKADMKPWYKK